MLKPTNTRLFDIYIFAQIQCSYREDARVFLVPKKEGRGFLLCIKLQSYRGVLITYNVKQATNVVGLVTLMLLRIAFCIFFLHLIV